MGVSDHAEMLADFRHLRESLERSVLPLATSVDGRRFSFQVSLHDIPTEVGGYVALEAGDGVRIGQVLSLGMEQHEAGALDRPGTVLVRTARGEGVMLDGLAAPFHDAALRPANPDEVGAWLKRVEPDRAGLAVGELALAPGVRFELDAGGFGRHTFLCGQSGSGKTYSLGVLLEQLLVQTDLRVVVLDPNSDYVRLGEPRADADGAAVERYRPAAEAVGVRSAAEGETGIRVRFRDLSPEHRAALLALDPLADREEYAELLDVLEDEGIRSVDDLAGSPATGLKLRARNLGVDRWQIWPRGDAESLQDELADPGGARCLVVDLGSLDTQEEQTVAAGAVLEQLWKQRASRRPVAIVIDEAQNVCPAEPGGPLAALSTQTAIRIAGEGRKFGLYLIVVTQRPEKVHENVLSQCDNLVLMRMNSVSDLAHIAKVFSFVAPGMVDQAVNFGQGEALVAGKIASHPALIRFGSRISHEGGADVEGWAGARDPDA